MSDVEREEQRALALSALRYAKKAIVFTIDEDGEPSIAYINVTAIEHRGIIELLQDTAPKWILDDEK